MKIRDLNSAIQIRLVESFFSRLVSMVMVIFMPIYFVIQFGTTVGGVLVAVNVVLGLLASFVSGYYSDKVGRKPIMVIGEVARVISFVLIIISYLYFPSPLFIMAMMTVNTMAFSFYRPASEAMLLDISSPEERKYMYTYLYWMFNLSVGFASIIGGLFFKSNFLLLMIILTVASLITLLLVLTVIKEKYEPSENNEKTLTPWETMKEMGHNYKQVSKNKLFMVYLFASVLFFTLEAQVSNYIGVRIEQEVPSSSLFGFEVDGVKLIGILNLENALFVLVMAGMATFLMKHLKDLTALNVGMLIYTVGIVGMCLTNNPYLLVAAMLISTFGELLGVPIKEAYLGDIAPEDARTAYLAVSNMAMEIGLVIASGFIILGGLFNNVVIAAIFAVIGIISMVMFTRVGKEIDRRKESRT